MFYDRATMNLFFCLVQVKINKDASESVFHGSVHIYSINLISRSIMRHLCVRGLSLRL